jgi:SpoIID/LytB domain protein
VIEGELRIRRAFHNLDSAMFLVTRRGDDWEFRGGGWGHGAGMCQWGAVGRARAGQDYKEILGAYFGGAEVAKIY